MRIFARGTLLLFRCFRKHVKNVCFVEILCYKFGLNDEFTSAQTVMLRDRVVFVVSKHLWWEFLYGEPCLRLDNYPSQSIAFSRQ